MTIQAPQGQYECAVDVSAPCGIPVQYREFRNLDTAFATVSGLNPGWHTLHGLGVHDIHYNQGDPPGQFQHLDGIWQDGGTIIDGPHGELTAFLTKFKPRVLDTDDNGLPH